MLARPRPSPRRWATGAGWGGPWAGSRSYAWMAGDPDRALELAQRALVLATAHDDVPFQAWANLRLGMVGQTIGEYRPGCRSPPPGRGGASG